MGLILVGAGLYRMGFMDGGLPTSTYRLTAVVGLAVGLPLAVIGVIITAVNDYSREVAFVGQIPNTIGTVPFALGYMSLVILWSNREDSWLKQRLRAVGKMALTNYLMQTVLGVIVLTTLLGDVDFVNRGVVLAFVLAVWALQLWWSQMWLDRFMFGPAEWLWRVGTYRRRAAALPPPGLRACSVGRCAAPGEHGRIALVALAPDLDFVELGPTTVGV